MSLTSRLTSITSDERQDDSMALGAPALVSHTPSQKVARSEILNRRPNFEKMDLAEIQICWVMLSMWGSEDAKARQDGMSLSGGTEASRVKKRLLGFSPEDSPACQWIHRWWPGLVRRELTAIALVLSWNLSTCPVDRDAKRDGRVLQKWFDENWAIIQPYLEEVHLLDEQQRPVNFTNGTPT